jgi:hypothetical protein
MKTPPVAIIVLFLVMILLPGCSGVEEVASEDNSDSARELAERFSPIILLKNDEAPLENYEPAPVQTLVDQAEILSMENSFFTEKATINSMEQYSESQYYLDIPDLSPAYFQQSLQGYQETYNQAMASGLSPTAYARVLKPEGFQHTVVQYWLFYYFDEWSNLHEGDWELVELVFPDLSARELVETWGEPEFAAYSQHQAGQRMSWTEMREKGLVVDTHPLVYVSRGSHANYFTPGQYWLISDFDDTGLSDWREIRSTLIMISERDPDNDKNQWLDFQGCWGEHLNFEITMDPLKWTQCGPNGPVWGGGGNKSQKWQQPYKWAEKLAEYPQVYFISFLPKLARVWPVLAIFSIFSPADIHVYDRYGRHAGLNEEGEFETQIPGAEYITPEGSHSKTIIIADGDVSQGYTLIIKGNDHGRTDIKVQIPDAGKNVKRYLEYQDIPVTPTTVARLQFTGTPYESPPRNSLSVRDNTTILEIDQNNDGQYESKVEPGTSDIVPEEKEPVQMTLTLKVEGAGTARAVDGDTYSREAEAVIIAEAEKGWVFDHWGGDASGTSPSMSVVMDRDKTIIAFFKPETRQFALTIGVVGEGGATNPRPGTYFFDEGSEVLVQAIPEKGYEFAGWDGNYGIEPMLGLLMNRDINITASFRPIETGPAIDQSNEPPWDGGWMNIDPENQAGQSIVTDSPVLIAVEVDILTANAVKGGDTITMNILYEGQQLIASVSQYVEEGFNGWLMFEMPKGGINIPPGTELIIQLEDTGKTVFGWKYAADTYPSGTMFFFGRSQKGDFFFRTYGATVE